MKNVFVAMPFNDTIAENLYRLSIKPICKKFNLSAIRADEIFSPNPIIEDIITAVENAKVIIVDISGRNSNVFYELGMSHTLKRGQTIMITRDHYKEIPFDVGHFRIIKYDDSISGKSIFEQNLKRTLKTILADPRIHKIEEFTHVVRILKSVERGNELGNIVARRALGYSPEINSVWLYEVFSPGKDRQSVIAIYDFGSFRSCHELGYVKFTEKTINFTRAGEAFADFLKKIGYRCAYINGKSLIKGYRPSNFVREHESEIKKIQDQIQKAH